MDFHLHTNFTDGANTVVEVVEEASNKGILNIAFTEHVNKRYSSSWFSSYLEQVEEAKHRYPYMKIYTSIEVKAVNYNGELDAYPEWLDKVDFTLGVLHSFPKSNGHFWQSIELPTEEAIKIDEIVQRALLMNPRVDVLAHLGGMLLCNYDIEYDDAILDSLILLAKENNKVIELNGKPAYERIYMQLLRSCVKHNVFVSIGSDAHSVDEIGRGWAKIMKARHEIQ